MSNDQQQAKDFAAAFENVERFAENARKTALQHGRAPWMAEMIAVEQEVQCNLAHLHPNFLPENRRTNGCLVLIELLRVGCVFADARQDIEIYRELLRLGRGFPNYAIHMAGPSLSVAFSPPPAPPSTS